MTRITRFVLLYHTDIAHTHTHTHTQHTHTHTHTFAQIFIEFSY